MQTKEEKNEKNYDKIKSTIYLHIYILQYQNTVKQTHFI